MNFAVDGGYMGVDAPDLSKELPLRTTWDTTNKGLFGAVPGFLPEGIPAFNPPDVPAGFQLFRALAPKRIGYTTPASEPLDLDSPYLLFYVAINGTPIHDLLPKGFGNKRDVEAQFEKAKVLVEVEDADFENGIGVGLDQNDEFTLSWHVNPSLVAMDDFKTQFTSNDVLPRVGYLQFAPGETGGEELVDFSYAYKQAPWTMKMDDGTWQRVRQPGGNSAQIITIANPVFTVCSVEARTNYEADGFLPDQALPLTPVKNFRRRQGFSGLDWLVVPKYKKVRASFATVRQPVAFGEHVAIDSTPYGIPELFLTDPGFVASFNTTTAEGQKDPTDTTTAGGCNFWIGRPPGVPSSKRHGFAHLVFQLSTFQLFSGNLGPGIKIIPSEFAAVSVNPQQVVTKILPPEVRGDMTINSGQFVTEEEYANDTEFVLLWNEEAETAVPPHPCKPPTITLGTGWQIENPLP